MVAKQGAAHGADSALYTARRLTKPSAVAALMPDVYLTSSAHVVMHHFLWPLSACCEFASDANASAADLPVRCPLFT